MKTKFAVGDRVAVYDGVRRGVGIVQNEIGGTVYIIAEHGRIADDWLKGKRWNPKQLRRLKSRKPPREWWIYANTKLPGWDYGVSEKPVANTYDRIFHVTELPPGSAVVTRESLAAKWDIIAKAESLASAVLVCVQCIL